jgi:xanthine dehydrogenase accessory factor
VRTPARYVGLVASAKRAAGVVEWLRSRGASDEALARLRSPAGLDLGPVDHDEIAVAILAELVALRATGGFTEVIEVSQPETAIDPVCEMTVDVATARFVTEHAGATYYFCAAGCQRAFEANPENFLS